MFALMLDGDEALETRFAAMPANVQAALRAKAEALAQALVAHVVRDKLSGQVMKTRTGALKASIAAEVSDGDRLMVSLFSSGEVKYAAIQELGGRTGAHDIVPVKAKALAFLAGGRRVFARIVHHPGSSLPARSYLGSAMADMAPQIAAELEAAAVAALGD